MNLIQSMCDFGKNINLKYLNIDLFNYLDLFFSLIKFSNPLPKD